MANTNNTNIYHQEGKAMANKNNTNIYHQREKLFLTEPAEIYWQDQIY